MSRLLGLLLATAPALLALSSCGPSVQSIYEGNVRFEHCYRLDLDLDVAQSHRQACWKTWLDSYTYGQSRDRIEYARRRVRAFASGDGSGPSLQVGGVKREETRQFYLVVPAPTSVHASPPPIATRVNAPAPPPPAESAEPVEGGSPAPGEGCAGECRTAFSGCSKACEPDAKTAACTRCEPDYKKCMLRCFE